MVARVPTVKISSGLGSSTEASCCVARKIFLSPASASSRARTEASRPTIKGCIICGKMTISRTGIIGTRLISLFSRLNITFEGGFRFSTSPELSRFFQQVPIDVAVADHICSDGKLAQLALGRQVVHEVQHKIFENHAEAAGAHFALQSQLRHRF